MEIHAPEKPILTVREAIVHLGIVTAGILIALSLESVVEYVHHRSIVREAREIMKNEIEANQKDLNLTMDRIALQKDGLVKGIRIFSAMAKGEKPKIEGLRWMLDHRTAELPSERLCEVSRGRLEAEAGRD
jgi:plasmid stability protein